MSIRVNDLHVKYLYGAEAIKGLSFECGDGERIAVLSASEGGKTSLLKCIAGLYPATGGKIIINGKDVTAQKTKARDVLMIYDDGGILKNRSLRFHLEHSLKLRKVDKTARKERVLAVSKRFGLYPSLSAPARYLYEDDIIRLSFARAAIREAAVYLIDDPFGMLKGEERRELFLEMLPAIRELKGSVIFATPSPDEAFTVGDKVLVLNYGNLEQAGTPEEIMSSPATLTVDKLANRHNARVETVIHRDENGAFAIICSKRYAVPAELEGKKVIISFSVKECGDGEAFYPSDYGYLAGKKYVSFAGGILFVSGEVKKEYRVAPEGSIHIFDAASEKRLTSVI